jgi:hypothetical protein
LPALTAATNNTKLIRNRDYEYRASKDLLTQIKRRASSLLLLGRFHAEFVRRLLRSLASFAISSYADTEPELRERDNEEADGQGQERERKKCRDIERTNCSDPLGQEQYV